jgi:hypothetical protein
LAVCQLSRAVETRGGSKRVGPGERKETWFIFGFQVEGPVTKEDCQRILSQLKEKKKDNK